MLNLVGVETFTTFTTTVTPSNRQGEAWAGIDTHIRTRATDSLGKAVSAGSAERLPSNGGIPSNSQIVSRWLVCWLVFWLFHLLGSHFTAISRS
jgi:hypothetical protein